jgi:hypothetical protein
VNVQVVIGFAEAFSAPEVVWSLKGCGFSVVAFGRKGSCAALRSSRYASVFDVTPPEQNAASAVQEVLQRVKELLQPGNTQVVLLPLDDAGLWICGELPRNERLITIGGGKAEVGFALDKQQQIQMAREAGFRVPETLTILGHEGVKARGLKFPTFVKPARPMSCRDGRLVKPRFHICSNEAELDSAIRSCRPGEPMLAQQYVAGVGEGLFGLATPRGVLAWSGHRRIRMMNPLGSGASACRSLSPDNRDIAAARTLIERVGWRGPFMIELLRDAEGRIWFMEFNGRVWGSTALARRCGFEYPAWAISEAIGVGSNAPLAFQAGPEVVCRHAGRELMHALFVMRGARGRRTASWPSRWRTLSDLLRFRKAEYWYNWRRDEWRVFVKDFVATIWSTL